MFSERVRRNILIPIRTKTKYDFVCECLSTREDIPDAGGEILPTTNEPAHAKLTAAAFRPINQRAAGDRANGDGNYMPKKLINK